MLTIFKFLSCGRNRKDIKFSSKIYENKSTDEYYVETTGFSLIFSMQHHMSNAHSVLCHPSHHIENGSILTRLLRLGHGRVVCSLCRFLLLTVEKYGRQVKGSTLSLHSSQSQALQSLHTYTFQISISMFSSIDFMSFLPLSVSTTKQYRNGIAFRFHPSPTTLFLCLLLSDMYYGSVSYICSCFDFDLYIYY